MNLFVWMLCLTMNMRYQFYSFVPLVTFWFVVQTVTMKLELPVKVFDPSQVERKALCQSMSKMFFAAMKQFAIILINC